MSVFWKLFRFIPEKDEDGNLMYPEDFDVQYTTSNDVKYTLLDFDDENGDVNGKEKMQQYIIAKKTISNNVFYCPLLF